MSEPPAYACSCLNVRILATNDRLVSPSRQSQDESRSRPPLPVAGWEALFVEPPSIKIAHEQLTSKSRSQDQVPLLICRLCNTLVCRLIDTDFSSSSTSAASGMGGFNSPAMGNPMSPSRDRPEFDIFMQKDKPMWIQVCTGKDGCITGNELNTALKKVSPVFGIIIPTLNTASPSPTPPTNPLPLPTPQFVAWPELFPPPPFVPNHPLFAHLSKEAKKSSAVIRAKAEEEMAKFIEQKRKEVAEQESNLKSQVNSIWRAWRESQEKSLPQGVPADPKVHTKRHASTPSTTTVIRTFQAEPIQDSRPSRPAYHQTHSSVSALATSLKQSAMHMPKPPSPQPSSPPSPYSEDLQATYRDSLRDPRPQKNTTIEPVSPPSSTNSTSKKNSDSTSSRTKGAKASALKRSSVDGTNIRATDSHVDGTSTPGLSANEEGAATEKRKVKFSSEKPNVVTVTREIKSEKLAKKEADRARSEEAMFDIDEEGEGPPKPSPAVMSTSRTNADRKVPTDFATADTDGHHPEVMLSFQMPSPVTNRKTKFEYTMAKSLPAGSILHTNRAPRAAALGLHADGVDEETNVRVTTSYRAQNDELRRMMAGQTPSHRSAWAAGEFFKPNAAQKRGGTEEEDDDDDDEDDDHTLSTHGHLALSTSVPIGILPSFQRRPATDDNFEATMSRSVDPGPALDLMVGFRRPRNQNSDGEDDDDLSDDDKEAKDLMRKMTEGRGSLHAQRILSRSMA